MPFKTGMNHHSITFYLALATLFLPFTAKPADLGLYSMPKQIIAPPQKPPVPAINHKTLSWTTPKDWVEQPHTDLQTAHFSVPGPDKAKADMVILSFSGLVGDEIVNVNQWRAEVGLPPIEPTDITFDQIVVGKQQGKLYQFFGTEKATMIVWLTRNDTFWFFKLHGSTNAVSANKSAMMEFLKSVNFLSPPAPEIQGQTQQTLLPTNTSTPPSDMASSDAAMRMPIWETPDTWQKQIGPRPILRSYVIKSSKGIALLWISYLPGEGNGVLTNINTWRAKIGMPPISEPDIAKTSETINVPGSKAILVNLSKDQESRLIGVYVRHGDSTWLYKLIGDSSAVESEKDNLIQVIKNVRYP